VFDVRDARGRFHWEVRERAAPMPWRAQAPPAELPPLPVAEPRTIGDDGEGGECPPSCADPEFDRPADFAAQSHIAARAAECRGPRHDAIDFLLKTGLCRVCSALGEAAAASIERFDAVDDAAVVEVPVLHFSLAGELQEPTPLFRRFFALLGEKKGPGIGRPTLHLGLVTLEFTRGVGTGAGDAAVLFSEAPLRLNEKHESFPQSSLLFVVTPIDQRFYSISGHATDPAFWCDGLHCRLIAAERLAQVLAVGIFAHIARSRRSLLFAKDNQRADILQKIERIPLSEVDLAARTVPPDLPSPGIA
jgi:hypothetical protein